MKLKLFQIVTAVESGAIAKLEAGSPPWRCRLDIARLTEEILLEYQRYKRLHNAAVMEYGVPSLDEKRQKVVMIAHPDNTPEKIKAFSDALSTLLDSDIELVSKPISIAALSDSIPLNIGDVRALGSLLKDDVA
jgi:hypothetical protein